ncbi:MAG: hypothetical protein ACFFCW_00975 [Candidatus Hodarchaeota archaeon]
MKFSHFSFIAELFEPTGSIASFDGGIFLDDIGIAKDFLVEPFDHFLVE